MASTPITAPARVARKVVTDPVFMDPTATGEPWLLLGLALFLGIGFLVLAWVILRRIGGDKDPSQPDQ